MIKKVSFKKMDMHQVIVLGKESVGKSCVIQSYVQNQFPFIDRPTINCQLYPITENIKICDTPGREIFYKIKDYFKNVSVVVLMFDITRKSTFKFLSFYMNQLKKYVPYNPYILLCGNKRDLKREQVTSEEIEYFVKNHSIDQYIEISAKTGHNISLLFSKIIEYYVMHSFRNSNEEIRLHYSDHIIYNLS